MQSNRCPHLSYILFFNALLSQMRRCGVCAFDFEALGAVEAGCDAGVVEDAGCEEEGEFVWLGPGGGFACSEILGVDVHAEGVV